MDNPREPRTLTDEEVSVIRGLDLKPISQVVSTRLKSLDFSVIMYIIHRIRGVAYGLWKMKMALRIWLNPY